MSSNSIKNKFTRIFNEVLRDNTPLNLLLSEIFTYGNAYLVGGFLRDIIDDKKYRDIDIIVDLDHDNLIQLVKELNIIYKVNRHNGMKIKFQYFHVDLWSINNNWAFKNKLVKLNIEDKLNSIAKGCFYNYDALVINLKDHRFNIKYYKDFLKKNELDILQKRPSYRNLNPTIEANILRAFYLKKQYNINYSENTKKYLVGKLGHLNDKYGNNFYRLLEVKSKYPKYDIFINNSDLEKYISELIDLDSIYNQFLIKL